MRSSLLTAMPMPWLRHLVVLSQQGADIRDVKPPLTLPANFLWLLFAFLMLAMLAFAWFVRPWLRRRKRERPAARVPPVSPWVRALKDLELLRQAGLVAGGRQKDYYTRLSDILRRYIEDRFEIPAPEMTTPEFLSQMMTETRLSVSQKDAIRAFLERCDMVKFAKYLSNEHEAEQSFALVKAFVRDTIPRPETDAEPQTTRPQAEQEEVLRTDVV